MSLEIVSAASVPFDDFTDLLNRAYADYYVPLHMSTDQLRARIVQDSIDMGASRVALQDGKPVGLGMLGRRGDRGWIGGMGVPSEHRRSGTGRAIMMALIESARALKLTQLQLEVISENVPAFTLYKALGFETTRTLYVAEGVIQTKPGTHEVVDNFPVRDVLTYYDEFHTVPNPWQREMDVLRALEPALNALVAKDEHGEILAYVAGVFHPNAIRFVDLAHAPRKGGGSALRTLIAYLHQHYPLATGSIINVGEDDPAWPVLFVLGYKSFLSQYEMVLKLQTEDESA